MKTFHSNCFCKMQTALNLSVSTWLVGGCLIFVAPSASGQEAPPISKLEGGINHQEILQPLFSGLEPGKEFSAGQYQSPPKGTWEKIPNWLSGTWTSLSALRTFKYDEKTGQTDNSSQIIQRKSQEVFGLQRDGAGDIWTLTADPSPVLGQEESLEGTDGGAAEKKTLKIYSLSKNDYKPLGKDRLEIQGISTDARVDAASNKVMNIESHKTERQFVLLAEDLIACNVDDKCFSREGFPISRQKYVIVYRRTQPFGSQNERESLVLRSAFEKFLEGIGRLDLKNGI